MSELTDLTYLAKGCRGIVYTADYNGKKVVVKKEKEGSKAINRLQNEANFLKILNKESIGPKFYFCDETSLVSEYIEGELFPEWLKKANSKDSLKVIRDIYAQCFKMDKLKISKEEMHHPPKHILIRKGKPVMIDFERCHKSPEPTNVTQFSSYMLSRNITTSLNKKNITVDKEGLISSCKEYKANMTREKFKKVLSAIK
ncbi:MAG TPA: hypothetical protein VFF28_06265 [Candidatus Nanoarchaeia archaeon]|nr:hypothetical protein [Candidatus Nanoarchaeia archaeon]